MTEEDTFLKLKRIPISELENRFGTDEALREFWYAKSEQAFGDFLESHGWEYKDYKKWLKTKRLKMIHSTV